jgi:hypothetical protein
MQETLLLILVIKIRHSLRFKIIISVDFFFSYLGSFYSFLNYYIFYFINKNLKHNSKFYIFKIIF